MRNLSTWILAGMMVLMAGCTPTTKIKEPLTVRPVIQSKVNTFENGSIFQAGVSRPLFEDRRARNVGDVLTINITEATTATEKSSTNASNTGTLSMQLPTNALTTGNNAVKSGSTSDNSGTNAFSGTITVTVIEVLKNGNLLVTGEKMVTVKYSNQYVRFSGIINPSVISANNTVLSSQVADVQVEFKNANNIDSAAVATMFSRIFLAILPF